MSEPSERPYVLLSCAMSIDGYIDDSAAERLLLSNEADFDRVDAVRAESDAILVGANTIRRDNPRLLIRSAERRADRTRHGRPASPAKVTMTGTGDLDPTAKFFAAGDSAKIVYCATPAVAKARDILADAAAVVDAGEPLDLSLVLDDLSGRGIRRLLVEGGGSVHTQFLTAGLADELHVVVAPFFVGDPKAPRFVDAGTFPNNATHRAALADVLRIDDVVLLRYALSDRFGAT